MAASAHADVVACSHVERVARPRREVDLAFVRTQDFSVRRLVVLAGLVKRRVVVNDELLNLATEMNTSTVICSLFLSSLSLSGFIIHPFPNN